MLILYLMVAVGVYIGCHIHKSSSKELSLIQKVITAILWPVLVGVLIVSLYEKAGD